MYDIIIVRNGEIAIKKRNRYQFESSLIKQLNNKIKYTNSKAKKKNGRIEIDLNGEAASKIIDLIKDSFGVVSLSPAIRKEKGFETLKEGIYSLIKNEIPYDDGSTFKISVKRYDKTFEMETLEMNSDLGEFVLNNFPNLVVNVKEPKYLINCEFRKEENLIYFKKIKGAGGMPLETAGKGMALLSGGIDSPVAIYLMARRGLHIDTVHFHSFPFTSQRSKEKVKDLLSHLSSHIRNPKLYMINMLEIQREIQEKCPSEHLTIITRRFMMKIAEKISKMEESQMLITGESLGQVASQTSEGLICTNNAVKDIPVMRPLIAMEKENIIKISKEIGTYDISIIQEDDCCTIFLPEKVATRPKLEKILEYEEVLDSEKLIKSSIENMELFEM